MRQSTDRPGWRPDFGDKPTIGKTEVYFRGTYPVPSLWGVGVLLPFVTSETVPGGLTADHNYVMSADGEDFTLEQHLARVAAASEDYTL